ncbi:zinc finger BED domain-containing protein 4-like [Onthophagus taurus]|uniref:zinc finger BED domain-containing protein 4-like n=1 Tax=Onthophagus taurus TaxID=166361 RepID=UPI0039BDC7DE
MSDINKKSDVWTFFDKCEDLKFAKCKLCQQEISRGGTGKYASTTSMINHVKRKHAEEFEKRKRLLSESEQNKTNPENDLNIVQKKQETLTEFINKSKQWDINDKRSKKMHYAIGEMIALDNMPYLCVENTGFTRLMNKICPQYKVPRRKYFSETIIPDIYDRLVEAIKKKIDGVQYLSVTSDIWTCSHTNESFISFTAHWLNTNFGFNHVLLNCKHFPESHTAENIKQMFLDMLQMWNLDISQVHVIVRDNGANIVKACNDAKLVGVPCFIHTLQLVIIHAIKTQRSIVDLIAVCRKIVGHFNHSPAACSKLKDIQTELNVDHKKLVQDVTTRWNSSFYMLQRILEQKRVLNIYAADNDIVTLNTNQWSLIQPLLDLLEPFEEITKVMSSNVAFISEVIPTITTLKVYLSKEDENLFHGVGTMKNCIYDEINRRFDSLLNNKFYIIATILDPRFKMTFFESNKIDYFKYILTSEYSQSESEPIINENYTPETKIRRLDDTISNETNKSKLWQCFDEIVSSRDSLPKPSENIKVKSIDEELNLYLNMDKLIRTDDPLVWWKAWKTTFPILTEIARKFLSAPAASVYSERVFSEAGNIYDQTRSRLLPRNAEKLLFIHHNLHKVNFEY